MNTQLRIPLVCLMALSLLVSACGPGQVFGPTLTPTSTATPVPTPTLTPTPAPSFGLWAGNTNEQYPVSFEVSANGSELIKFTLADVQFSTTDCGGASTGTIAQTIEGPFSIVNNQFSYSSESFSFSGEFTSTTTATGTYEYTKITIKVTGPPPAYLLKDCTFDFVHSGTWTVEAP